MRFHQPELPWGSTLNVRPIPPVIWGQATASNPETSTPADWGWIQSEEAWKINRTTLPPIAACCQELTKCCCKKDCLKRCKCFRAGLSCTALFVTSCVIVNRVQFSNIWQKILNNLCIIVLALMSCSCSTKSVFYLDSIIIQSINLVCDVVNKMCFDVVIFGLYY